MKKSINLWAFPYPQKMSLKECFQLCKDAGFDGVEVNYALEGDLSPESTPRADQGDRRAGPKDRHRDQRRLLVPVLAVCASRTKTPSGGRRASNWRGKMIEAARLLGTENLLVVPGAVYAPWIPTSRRCRTTCCDRATEGVKQTAPRGREGRVYLNIENIFANGFLHSPQEMNAVRRQLPERVRARSTSTPATSCSTTSPSTGFRCSASGSRTSTSRSTARRSTSSTCNAFRPLLDGTTNWPAVLEALDQVGYRGYLTFEYFNPFPHWPEALVYQTSDALDRMLGRKA